MYDRLIREHKLAAIYTISIISILFLTIFISNSKNTLTSQARDLNFLTRGCYYRLNCPPKTAGFQSIFTCQPLIVCPTPTFIRPTGTATTLSCKNCLANGNQNICFDTDAKMSYCSNLTATSAGVNCFSCGDSITPKPTCIMPPSCIYSNPRCLIPEPEQGWCPIPLTPQTTVKPTLTTTPVCQTLNCPVAPENCFYIGGDNCTTCGKMQCSIIEPSVTEFQPQPTFSAN